MTKEFKELSNYIRRFDGYGKPKLNFQEIYKLFPDLNFTGAREFGSYANFGKAFENKNLSMIVTSGNGDECLMVYKEYTDANENTAYVA